MDNYYWAYVLVMFIGLLGTFIPVMPGVPLIFLSLFIYAWNTGFVTITVPWLLFFAALTVFSWLVDYFSGIIGSKQAGLSKTGFWGMIIGSFIGFFFTPIGLLLGPVLGLIIGELIGGKNYEQILQTLKGTARGFLIGLALKIVIAIFMIGMFFYLT